MTVFDNIAYGLTVKKVPKAEIKERVKEMVENTAKGYGATGKVTYTDGYTALINHDEYIDIIKVPSSHFFKYFLPPIYHSFDIKTSASF